jgi:phosphate transport system substrate-binding protein
MKSSHAIRGLILVCATCLACFRGSAPAVAQSPVGLTVTICSKNDPKYQPQTGILVRLDEQYYIVHTSAGEMHFKRGDFENCQRASSSDAPACPAGQVAGANGCTCPASQTMRNGRCVAPSPVVVVAEPDRLPRCLNYEDITVQGSSTVGLGVMPSLIQGFANINGFEVVRSADDKNNLRLYQLRAANPSGRCFRISVRSTGSETAKDGITDKVAQIGMSSRDYTEGEIRVLANAAKLEAYERNQIEHVVALDAISVVVNRSNPVEAIGLCQIAQVFAGRIRDWRQLGGRPGPINLHVRTGTSGTFESFENLVMKTCGLELATAPSHGTYPDLLRAVAADEASIGFAPATLVTDSTRSLRLKGSCGIEQAVASFNVKTEDYPLARRLYVFTPFPLEGYARQFESFMVADDRADDLLSSPSAADGSREEAEGQTFDQKIEAMSDDHANSLNVPETKADRGSLQRFRDLSARGQRLSITYRFSLGSDLLDTKARQDVRRLARYLQNARTRPTVVLAGFTDDLGSVSANVELAARRAEAVRRELLAVAPTDHARNIRAEGFGKILPVTCNDTELGRAKNRRVEVLLVP